MPTDPADSTPPPAAFPARPVLWIVALALALRLAYLAESAGSPFFGFPILDEAYYDALGRGLAAGEDVRELNPGFRPFLYGGFLSLAHRVAGESGPVLARVLQHLVGAATVGLVVLLGARLGGRPAAGALAGALYALAGPPLFYEGQLLPDSLFAALLVAALLATRGGTTDAVAAGGLVGLAAQLRANGVVFLAAFPLLALRGESPPRERARRAVVALAGAVAVLALAALVQWPLVGRFQLLPSAGGVNLYLGNERGADGMIPRQDRAAVYGDAYRDSVQLFAEQVFREANPGARAEPAAVSRYWVGRTIDEVTADPGRWLGLVVKKAWLLVWDREVPNNLGYDFVRREESALLRALPVHPWMLLALLPAGVVAARRHEPRLLAAVAAFGLLHAALTVAFFVNGRYRLPLWPLAAALAGAGAIALVEAVRGRTLRRYGAALATGVVLAGLSLAPLATIPADAAARDVYFRSLARLAAGDVDGALADARRALALDPEEAGAHLQLGLALLAAERTAEAAAAFEEVVRRRPAEPRGHNGLAIAHERLGREVEAFRGYLHAAGLPPGFAPAATNAALLAIRGDRLDDAGALLARAAALGAKPAQDVAILVASAEIARRRGDPAAEDLLARARELDPAAVDRLLADLARPADLGPP